MSIRRISRSSVKSVKSVDFLCRLEQSAAIDTSGQVSDEADLHSILLFPLSVCPLFPV